MKCWIIKLRTIAIMFASLGITLSIFNGCVSKADNLYRGDYTVETEDAKNKNFALVIKALSDEIATCLGPNYEFVQNWTGLQGYFADIHQRVPIAKGTHVAEPAICIHWSTNQRPYFYIGISKGGRAETQEMLHIRRVIEDVLKKHPEFKWSYSIDDSYLPIN